MTKQPSGMSPEVDAYIDQAAPFAQPILKKIRMLFHKSSPNVQETMKWSFPHFEYKGLLGSMAAFKSYVGFGFWKGGLMQDPAGLFAGVGKTSMSALKVAELSDLPPEKVLMPYFREAVELNENDIKAPRPERTEKKPPLRPPKSFMDALKKNRKALGTFEGLPPSHKREYIEWITEAKLEVTRDRRIVTAIEQLEDGKSRHWKYEKSRR